MAIDPVDDCTFWYVGESYSTSSSIGWQTRIGSFKLSSCASTPDFSLNVSPASQPVVQGSSTNYTATVTPSNGFIQQVALAASGLPSGATASFSSSSTTATSTLTVSTTATLAIGSYPFTISGTAGPLQHLTAATLVVTSAGTFTLSVSPATSSVIQGSGTTYSVTVHPSGGFNSAVQLSVTGLPSGASGSFASNPTTSGSALQVTAASSTPAGTYALTIEGTSAGLSSQVAATLVVTINHSVILHIAAMNGYGQLYSRSWKGWADVTVHDQNGNPVAGVTVTFTFSGGASATRTCTTTSSGYCSTTANRVTISLNQHSETIIRAKWSSPGPPGMAPSSG